MATGQQYVFGYGSLLTTDAEPIPELTASRLRGHRRTWNVAMNNSQAIPGYKRYVDPVTGNPPAVFVVFLNIVADPGGEVNGALFPVSDEKLAALDRRERNYERIDVTAGLADPVAGSIWAYAGSSAGIERFEVGQRAGSAVISRGYVDDVRRGFASLGADAAAELESLTDPPPCPIVALRRVPVPLR
jgi:hypothetical protein